MLKQPNNSAGFSRLTSLVIVLVWTAALALVFANKQAITDWYRLRSYTAPAEIAAIAAQDTMTAEAKKYFYVNNPQLASKATFRSKCPNNGGEQTIVLGCYRSQQNGIFLLSVDDTRLQGVEAVTAAHEMLHAAYDRLSDSERERIDGLLQDYYQNGLTDSRIAKVIDGYKQSEPNDLVNEMHSIFATEITVLPPELEAYYQRYFTNRQAVTALAGNYQQEFTSRRTIVAGYDQQLQELKTNIDAGEADLKDRQANIQEQRRQLEALRTDNPAAYNSRVPGYNSAIDGYNAARQQLVGLVRQYNAIVEKRNAVAIEVDQLANDLNANAPALEN